MLLNSNIVELTPSHKFKERVNIFLHIKLKYYRVDHPLRINLKKKESIFEK